MRSRGMGLVARGLLLRAAPRPRPPPTGCRCRLQSSAATAHKAAYQGVPGAYSEEATLAFFDGKQELQADGLQTFQEVVDGVASGAYQSGVLPIEDSVTGTFHNVYDLLLRSSGSVTIVGELASHTEHCLCLHPGVPISRVISVGSHPAILAQCAGYLQRLEGRLAAIPVRDGGGGWGTGVLAQVPSMNSAESAQALSEQGPPSETDGARAVICSARAAELYGLEVVDNITDAPVSTRYVVIGREPRPLAIGTKVKSSIALALPNAPLSLFKALAATALRDINIAKIESRPAAASRAFAPAASFENWDYVFYLDLEAASRHGGKASMEQLDAAIANIREFAIELTELGRYSQNLPSKTISSHRDLYR